MKLIEHYFHLFAKYSQFIAFQEVKLTRSEISKELQCSERTVTNILNKMADKKWINRNKGEGRGNATTIIFLVTIEEMFDYFEDQSPDYDEIIRLISLFENNDLYNEIEQVFYGMILKLFGLKVDNVTKENENKNDYEHLKIPYFRIYNSLDPAVVERESERHIVEQIFNTLVTYSKESESIVPSISHYWEENNEGKEWTFYIRKGVNFHNNKNLTSKDIKFSFERLGNTPSKWIIRHLKSISCIGSHVIRFEFSQSMYNWDILISSPKCSIVPEDYGGKTKEIFAEVPIGTGPFMIEKHDETLLNLKVHPTYFKGRAYLDEITIFILPTIEKYFNANKMKREPLFYIPFSLEKDSDDGYNHVRRNHLSTKYLMWNMNKKTIRINHLLRRRVSLMINKDNMVRDLGYPRFKKANSFIDQENDDSSNSWIYQDTKYDESLTLMTYELTPNEDDINWIQTELTKYGIKLDIIQVPYSSFIEMSKQADLVLSGFLSENSREVSVYNLFLSESSVFSELYNLEEKVYKFCDKVMREKRQEKRFELLKQLEEKLIDQDIIIPLYTTFQKALIHKKLMGISLSTIGLVPFDRLFFRKN
ncbi:ABC transporter substrate-binding protein [Paraliobacillus zengyii]|uniref:ABC transporter substrate-binding protein n=1 Tax=Paraliobacillus zengyii TaxID=2213194 RepID=UPI000DD3D1EC|nr:ABC transporter substrate-binding protein [Paraliobacillus zengyii]